MPASRATATRGRVLESGQFFSIMRLRVAPMETLIRTFLRKHGWVPEDERENDPA